MRINYTACAGAILLSASSMLSAQAIVLGGPSAPMLRSGTEVQLRTLEELTTNGKLLKVGRRFNLETTDAISVNGQVVIPAGSRAVGEVTSIRNKGMWGKSGNIEARVVYVSANGRNIRASGTLSDKGTTGTAGVVGAIVLLPVAGFFMTGTSAVVRAFIDEDVAVAFAEGTGPAPMVVATPAAVSAPVGVVAAPAVAAPTATPVSAPSVLTKVSVPAK